MSKKPYLSVFLAALAAFLLASCGENARPKQDQPQKTDSGSGGFTDDAPVLKKDAAASPSGGTERPLVDPDFAAIRFDSAGPKSEKPMPKVEVQQDHIHEMSKEAAAHAAAIQTKRNSNWEVKSSVQPDSIAAQLGKANASKNTRTVWSPLEFSGDITPVRLPDVKLSPDKSMILFIETTGKAQGPFGSRVVLMDVSDWSVARIIEVPDRFIGRAAWIPGTKHIAVLCAKQPEMKQSYGVALIDLVSGKETAFRHVDEGAGRTAFLADSRGHLLLSHPKDPVIVALNAADLEEIRRIPVSGADSLAALAPDGKSVAFAAPKCKFIQVFKTADLQPISSEPMPEAYPLHKFFCLGKHGYFLCGDPSSGRESVILMAGKPRILDGWASGLGAVSGDGKTIFNVLRDENRICIVDAKSGSITQKISTNRAMPRMMSPGPGAISFFELIPAIHAMAILDTQGNFFLINTEFKDKQKHAERAIIFQRRQ